MGFRQSEYARIDNDTYVTPRWVWDALCTVEPWAKDAWDCAPVDATTDFMTEGYDVSRSRDISTNPPFKLSEKFVRHALGITSQRKGRVAMLLPHAWDTAKGRVDLFTAPNFKAKYVLTKRIRWENLEQKKNGPSSNHAWYVWNWGHNGPPVMGWIS